MKEFYAKWNIRHVTSSPFRPQGNGLAERFVRTFKEAMMKLKDEGREKCIALREFLQDYRFSPHSVTGEVPAERMFAFKVRNKFSVLKPQREPELKQVTKFKSGKVWVRQYLPNRTWIPGEVVGQKGLVTFVVLVSGGRLWKRHITQLRERVSDCSVHVRSEFDDVTELFSSDSLNSSGSVSASTNIAVSAPSPLLRQGWRSSRATKGVPPARFF